MTKDRRPPLVPPGGDRRLKGRALEHGSTASQRSTPLQGFDIYVAGCHCARHDPRMQMEAHHFCKQAYADVLQCVIFDGNTAEVNQTRFEYIISERLFLGLPAGEQALWHPHNSGELVAPGLPDAVERELTSLLVNSYGKTWRLWQPGRHGGEAVDPLPTGEPMLM